MGTDSWGNVVNKPKANETPDSALAKACGVESSTTPPISAASQPVVNVQTGPPPASTPVPVASSTIADTTPSSSNFALVSFSNPSSASPTAFSFSSVKPITQAPKPTTTSVPKFVPVSTSTVRRPTSSPPASTQPAPPPVHATTSQAAPGGGSDSSDTGSSSGGGSTSSSDIQQYLSAHNSVRAQHGAAPLSWSNNLAAKAQQWANNCVFKHSGGQLGPFGENLAAGTGSSYGIAAAIKSWTDEVSQYDPSNPQPSHFTQVAWKSTTQVGCAVQSCSGIFSASFGKAQFFCL